MFIYTYKVRTSWNWYQKLVSPTTLPEKLYRDEPNREPRSCENLIFVFNKTPNNVVIDVTKRKGIDSCDRWPGQDKQLSFCDNTKSNSFSF